MSPRDRALRGHPQNRLLADVAARELTPYGLLLIAYFEGTSQRLNHDTVSTGGAGAHRGRARLAPRAQPPPQGAQAAPRGRLRRGRADAPQPRAVPGSLEARQVRRGARDRLWLRRLPGLRLRRPCGRSADALRISRAVSAAERAYCPQRRGAAKPVRVRLRAARRLRTDRRLQTRGRRRRQRIWLRLLTSDVRGHESPVARSMIVGHAIATRVSRQRSRAQVSTSEALRQLTERG